MPRVFKTIRTIITGPGSIADLGRVASGLGKRALVVSGGGSLERAGGLERARESLREAKVEFEEHAGVLPEPDLASAELLRGRLHEGFDIVVSIGGGSVIDVAKAAAALVREEGPAREYQSGREITTAGLPHIAIPTTAGTGSEVTPNAVLTDPDGPRKASIRDDALFPEAAIVDPELLVSLPPRATAESGMDALTQAIESYVSVNATPLTEALSLQAISLLAKGLVRAFEDGADVEARTACAYGSLAAGMALTNARLGVVHGLAHPIGARCGLSHGLVCAVLLAPSLRLNEPAAPGKYAEVARRLAEGFSRAEMRGLTRAGITREEVERGTGEAPRGAPRADELAEAMRERLEIPVKLPDPPDGKDIPAIVAESMPSGSLKANPFKVEPAHVEKLLREVLGG